MNFFHCFTDGGGQLPLPTCDNWWPLLFCFSYKELRQNLRRGERLARTIMQPLRYALPIFLKRRENDRHRLRISFCF